MFLNLGHKKLQVYNISRELMKASYAVTLRLPDEEKFNLVQQIRRASLSVKLNIAEGASRKSEVERKRFWEISRGSVIEIDAAAEAIVDLEYLPEGELEELGRLLNSCFALLTKMTERK
ncbi:MAG TPA: four helix bundle protein [Agriterribacter sp.]|nr:four helix bundle protein [Agriterribacter sp.]